MTCLARLGTAVLWVLVSACGSRSALPSDAGTGGSADPCVAPSIPLACAESIAAAPAGAEVWSRGLPVGELSLLGPVAADDAGSTYYLGAESALYVKTVYALDACGELRWQADVSHSIAASGYVPQVMVAGGRLLLVGIGSIVALHLDTGEPAFIADLEGFAQGGGLGVPPGKVVGMGFTAADAQGTVFSLVANDLDVFIVSVSVTGELHPVARVEHYLGGAGYPLGAQQLALDAAGHVVLAGGTGSGNGEPIRAFTKSGNAVFDTMLPSFGIGHSLAGGPDFITGRGLWILELDGTPRGTFVGGGPTLISWDGPTVVDAEGTLHVVGGQHLEPGVSTMTFNLLGRFSPEGTSEWTATLDEQIVGGPVLDDRGHLFVTTSAKVEPGSPLHLSAIGLNGELAWQIPLPPTGKTPSYWLLPNAAGALTVAIDGRVHAYSSGGGRPPRCAYWPTPRGDLGQRVCARER